MSLPRVHAAASLLVAAACAVGPAGIAAAAPLTLGHAIEQALTRNPALAAFAFRLRAQEGRSEIAGLRPPLQFRAEAANVLGTGRTQGFDAAEATFTLSHVVKLNGKRERRLDAVAAGRSLIQAERAAAQLDVLAEVTRRFIHVAADQEQLGLTEQATALAEQTVTAATVRVTAGRAPEVEIRRSRISLAQARVEQEHAEHELLSSRRKLAAMWGESDARIGTVSADLYAMPVAESFELLVARLAGNPDFTLFASESRLRDAEIRLAESRRRADIAYFAGVRRLEDSRDQAFVAGITIPLAGRDRARGAVIEATALRELTAVEQEAHRIQTEARLFEIHQELNHSRTEVRMLRTDVLPEMEAVLEATRYAFERGRYSWLEWADARRELVGMQRALI